MIEGLKEIGGIEVPEDLAAPETNQFLRDTCQRLNVVCSPPLTTARLLDKVRDPPPPLFAWLVYVQ